MTSLHRLTVVYTGLPGLPGTNTMYADSGNITAADFVSAVHDFFNDIKNNLCNTLTITILGDVEEIDSTTGNVTSVTSTGGNDIQQGGNSGDPLPLVCQGLVQWRTGVFFGGRELRGRSYIPGWVMGLSIDGAPDPDLVTGLQGPIDTMAQDVLAVYSPTKHEWASGSSGHFWDQWAELRSRRD